MMTMATATTSTSSNTHHASHNAEIEKRVMDAQAAGDVDDDEGASIPTMPKKRKLLLDTPSTNHASIFTTPGGIKSSRHQPSELASAMALASLAGLGHPPSSSNLSMEGGISSDETRSPKATEAPTSPDQRTPGSPRHQSVGDDEGQQDHEEEIPDTPGSNKRVHFATGTKEGMAIHATPSADEVTSGGAGSSRLLMMPPHGPPMGPFGARPQPPMHFSPASYRSPPPMSQYPLPSPHPPSPFYHHRLQYPGGGPQPWFHNPSMAAAMASRMSYPPHRLMQPALMHPENQWICDYCNVASFSSYDECCAHEQTCKACNQGAKAGMASSISKASAMLPPYGGVPVSPYQKYYPGSPQANQHMLMSRSESGGADEDDYSVVETGPIAAADSDTWHTGRMSLAMGESDSEWLSESNCYIRRHCVEVFSATEDDAAKSSKRGRVVLNQVGIRCRFCAGTHNAEKAVAAVSFPTSIGGIYESVKRWQRSHVDLCKSIPPEVRSKVESLSLSSVSVPTTRQYWIDSAKVMGLVNTTEGIRFGVDPEEITSRLAKEDGLKIPPLLHPPRGVGPPNHSSMHGKMAGLAFAALGTSEIPPNSDGIDNEVSTSSSGHVVFPEDMEMIPTYVYFLMRQVEPCRFTEADRFVARSKGPVGYPGFQCRHCQGHAGLGKYFPVSAKSLSTNSTSQNIHAHILKCRKTPTAVKDRLLQLKIEKGRSPRLEPGWRKVFFDKVWARLHDE